jgi:hypothetical protein
VAETTVKILLCCGFRRSGKAMDQGHQYWLRIYREINVFLRFRYRMFYVLYLFLAYLLTLPRIIDYINSGYRSLTLFQAFKDD